MPPNHLTVRLPTPPPPRPPDAATLLPPALPCGHHVARRDLEAVVALHQQHQQALDVGILSFGDDATPHAAHSGVDASHSHGHHDHDGHDHEHDGLASEMHDGPQAAEHLVDLGVPLAHRRALAATATPAPIRLHVDYQLLDALDANQQQTLAGVVSAVVRILQKYIMVGLADS